MHGHPEVDPASIGICLVVTSDKVWRGLRRDEVTPLVEETLRRHGYSLRRSRVVPNSASLIGGAVLSSVEECDVVIVTGGTGPSPRDMSVDVVETLAEKRLPGFGELFRYLSFMEEGTKAWLSRASAYIVGGRLVVVVPGSPGASRLALEKILLPELRHVVGELRRT